MQTLAITTAAIAMIILCFLMRRYVHAFFKTIHVHNHSKPIVSMYRTFCFRDIIYECRCGDRKVFEIGRGYEDPFPIPTNMRVDNKSFQAILKGERNEITEWVLNYSNQHEQ